MTIERIAALVIGAGVGYYFVCHMMVAQRAA